VKARALEHEPGRELAEQLEWLAPDVIREITGATQKSGEEQQVGPDRKILAG
jgi:hypothetical protein